MDTDYFSTAILTLQVQIAVEDGYWRSHDNFVKVGLFQNAITPGPDTTLEQIVECDFSGYDATVRYPREFVYTGPDGRVTAAAQGTAFLHNGGPVSNTVYGWYLFRTFEPFYFGGAPLAAPRTMNTLGQGIYVVPNVKWGN